MNLPILFFGIESLFLVAVAIFYFIRHKQKLMNYKMIKFNYYLASLYAFFFFFSIIWFFNIIEYSSEDFSLIFALGMVVQTALLFSLFNRFILSKNVKFIFIFYIIILVSIFSSMNYFSSLILLASNFIIIFTMLNFFSSSKVIINIKILFILYAFLSLIIEVLIILNLISEFVRVLEILILILIFIYIYRNLEHLNLFSSQLLKIRKEKYFFLFVKFFLYLTVLINLSFIGVIAAHEFSHIAIARAYGCSSKAVIFETNSYPYSEIVCDNLNAKIPISLSGLVIPGLFCLFIIIFGEELIKKIGLLSLGFNMLASYKDLIETGVSQSVVLTVSILGGLFVAHSIISLTKFRISTYPN